MLVYRSVYLDIVAILLATFFSDGLIKCLFEWLSDLHLQNQKVTLNHLENKPTSFENIFWVQIWLISLENTSLFLCVLSTTWRVWFWYQCQVLKAKKQHQRKLGINSEKIEAFCKHKCLFLWLDLSLFCVFFNIRSINSGKYRGPEVAKRAEKIKWTISSYLAYRFRKNSR